MVVVTAPEPAFVTLGTAQIGIFLFLGVNRWNI